MKSSAIVAGVLTLALLGGYAALDAADLVPGILTTAPAIPSPAPRPEISVESAHESRDFASSPVPAADVSAALANFLANPALAGAVSVDLLDASTGERLAAHNETSVGPPASSTKVLTAAAALAQLGPTTTLPTTTVLTGKTLTLVGGGDLLLGTGEPRRGADGAASLTDLAVQTAAALQERSITEVTLEVDDSLFSGAGPAVWTEMDSRWVIDMTPLALHGGMVGVDSTENVRGVDFTIRTGEVFAAELAAQGIAVSAPRRGLAPADAEEVGRIESAPIETVTAWMLKTSNNSVAEALGRLVAISRGDGNTADAAAAAVMAQLGELGLPTAGETLFDVCGLAPENQVSTALLTATIELTLTDTIPAMVGLVPGLPVSYLDGTLVDRIPDAPGIVRAKTGTLASVVSLTGKVEADSGAVVIFSVMVTQLEPGSTLAVRAAIDGFVRELSQTA